MINAFFSSYFKTHILKSKSVLHHCASDCTTENTYTLCDSQRQMKDKVNQWFNLSYSHTDTNQPLTNCPKFAVATFSHLFLVSSLLPWQDCKGLWKIRQIVQATIPVRGYLGNTFSLLVATLWKEDWERWIKISSQEEVVIWSEALNTCDVIFFF